MRFLRISDMFINISDISRIESTHNSAFIKFKGSDKLISVQQKLDDYSFIDGKSVAVQLVKDIMDLENANDPYKEVRLALKKDLDAQQAIVATLNTRLSELTAENEKLKVLADRGRDIEALEQAENKGKLVKTTDVFDYPELPEATYAPRPGLLKKLKNLIKPT